MAKLLLILVLFGLVVLLWPAITAGLGTILPWIIWPALILLVLLGLSNTDKKPKQ